MKDDSTAVMNYGISYAAEMCKQLFESGHVHVPQRGRTRFKHAQTSLDAGPRPCEKRADGVGSSDLLDIKTSQLYDPYL